MTADRSSEPRPPARLETSAGGVLYRWIEGDPHFLLIRDRHGHWGLPKGHLEEGETEEEAALREIREETSLTVLSLGPHLQTIDWYFTNEHGTIHKYCHFYLVEAPDGDAVPLQAEGISECCWFPLDEALGRISYDNARDVLAMGGERVQKSAADPE